MSNSEMGVEARQPTDYSVCRHPMSFQILFQSIADEGESPWEEYERVDQMKAFRRGTPWPTRLRLWSGTP